jgi:hypothetical protein
VHLPSLPVTHVQHQNDSNHPRRLYESRVLPTELASRVFPRKLAGRAGFEPAHGVSNSHEPFELGYRPKNIRKKQKAPTFVGASEIESETWKSSLTFGD